jgi:hypothetical protein
MKTEKFFISPVANDVLLFGITLVQFLIAVIHANALGLTDPLLFLES